MSELAQGFVIGLAIIGAVFWIAMRSVGFTPKVTQSENAPALYQPHPVQAYQPPPKIMEVNSQVLLQGVAQQISCIGVNECFDVEHQITDTGQKIRFARIGLPPLVRPMAVQQIAQGVSHGTLGAGHLDVDGIPCMLKKSDTGFQLFKITPHGQLEFVCTLGAKL